MIASGLLGGSSSGGLDLGFDFFSGNLEIASGAGVDFLTIPGVAGKKAVLTGLFSSTDQTNISVNVGVRTAVTNLTLAANPNVTGEFSIGRTSSSMGDIASIDGKNGEAIVISKTSGTTSDVISYSYAYMVV